MELAEVRQEAEAEALAAESAHAAATSVKLRFFGVIAFLPILAVMHFVGAPGWSGQLIPVGLFSIVAGLLFWWRKETWIAPFVPYLFIFDVLLIFEVQRRSFSTSPHPAGAAGVSLGLFMLIIAMSAAAMKKDAIWLVTAFAIPAQFTLMTITDMQFGARMAAVASLVVLSLTLTDATRRIRRMVHELATTEVEWLRQNAHVQELQDARETIERMLKESHSQNQKLIELQADKDALSSLLVHDLRAPLSTLKANVDWVREMLPSGVEPEIPVVLDEVKEGTERLTSMIGDLLNITRLESGALPLDLETVPCRPLVESLHRHLQVMAKARNVSVELGTEDVLLECDQSLIIRTLENLATNALRYTPAGGRVRLEVRRSGDEAVFAIRNEGPSIALDDRPSLFDKYVQRGSRKDNRRAGWGLGLYFCRLCVDAHRGQIGLEDVEGWGTSFVVRLPLVAASNQGAQVHAEVPLQSTG